MDDLKSRLVSLLHYPDISWSTVYRVLKKDPDLDSVRSLSRTPLKEGLPFLISHTLKTPVTAYPNSFSYDMIQEQMNQYEANKIQVITIFDKEYPTILKEIYQPPWALFVKGDVSILEKQPKLAVVGSRQATQYGKNSIRLIFPRLMENGVVVVSGLAKGIDTLAHEYAIKNGGHTIAVIAGGFFHIYPKENINLALEMMKTQLIISEYPPDTKPLRWHFPARNRIISGLSRGTFIIEAKRKSGSLITANFAVNEGREVFALPGSIFNPFSMGTNDLIQQGAKLVTCADDILEEFQL